MASSDCGVTSKLKFEVFSGTVTLTEGSGSKVDWADSSS